MVQNKEGNWKIENALADIKQSFSRAANFIIFKVPPKNQL